MENSKLSELAAFMQVDYKDDKGLWLTGTASLRKIIGVLGMALPLLLYGGLAIFCGITSPLPSISHYYYTRVDSIFIIVISLMAIFLIVYKGKEPIDFWVSSIAGIFAFCVLLFPTDNISTPCIIGKDAAVSCLENNDFREYFHFISAAIFLLSLAYMALCLFTQSDKIPSKRGYPKIMRNRIYRTCGVVMILAILVVAIGMQTFYPIISPTFYEANHLTFWMETVAVEAFGVAWFIKGDTFWKD